MGNKVADYAYRLVMKHSDLRYKVMDKVVVPEGMYTTTYISDGAIMLDVYELTNGLRLEKMQVPLDNRSIEDIADEINITLARLELQYG